MDGTQPIFLLDDETEASGVAVVDLPLEMLELPHVKIGSFQGSGALTELVPMARGLLDLMVGRRVSELSARGLKIACNKGCHAACCRYLISVSVPEALMIVTEMQALPPDERNRIVNSCRATAERIQCQMAKGSIVAGGNVARDNLLRWYRELNISCPLLENNCCTIYDRRPIVCRECLAVGSPDQCRLDTEVQAHIRLPIHPANVLMRLTQQLFGGDGSIITLPGVFDWFAENAHLYRKTWPREVLVQQFVKIAMDQ